jgi:zinc/manganese transport system substrate-binding protein
MKRGMTLVLAAAGLNLLCRPLEGRELKTLTSFLPLYCFAANVAGNLGQVEALVSLNANPHDYQLTVKDRQRIEAADLVILNGLGLDAWMEPLVRGQEKALLVAASGLSNELIRISGVANPHIWLDPLLAIHCVTNILNGMAHLDPEHGQIYSRNASNYVQRLQALDGEIQTALLPFKGAVIVTFHDSFRYFARRYGLVIAGVVEEVPDVSPSARRLAELYRTIREKKPKCIFTEPQFPSRLAEQMARDLNVPIASLNTLETGPLKGDAYERGMRENLRVLQEKLK